MTSRKGIARVVEFLFGVRGIKIVKYLVLRVKMVIGFEPFTAINGLDRKVLPYMPAKGYFIEVGGNDGVDQSNTFYLEQKLGWDGLLIEPFLPLSRLSSYFRRGKSIHAALGAPEDAGKLLDIEFRDLMSSNISSGATIKWSGLGRNPKRVSAQIKTLSSILDENNAPPVSLLSLDVEGYELPVLRGLDVTRHRPAFILVETSQLDAVLAVLGSGYRLEAKLSLHDYLLKDVDPL